jgi:aerobic carbon-monoxide dehydrogenase medium subunit
MKLHTPDTLQEAISLLDHYDNARCIAGGQTLVAMMNADLVQPDALISLGRIGALRGIAPLVDGTIEIGAMTTHREIAAYDEFSPAQAIVGKAARRIAHPTIRNRGTIGGSIAHADPAADFPTALLVADAVIEVAGPRGRRTVRATDFFVDFLTTAVEPNEIVTSIRVPPGPQDARAHFEKFTRVDGDFAILSVAVVLGFSKQICSHARIALGAAGPTPVRSDKADIALAGREISDTTIAAAAAALAENCDPIDDFRGSAQYRLRIMPRLVRRAILTAMGRPS